MQAKVGQVSCGQALSAYAQWLAESLNRHGERQEQHAREITAVREAAAVGATALVELRAAVQHQLDAIVAKLQHLQEDLEATKVELAEVVIDKEGSQMELRSEVDALKQLTGVQSQSELLKQLQDSQLEAVDKKISEAVEKEASSLRQLLESRALLAEEKSSQKAETIRESVEKKLEEGLLEKVNMDLISKMDAVMDHLSQTQVEMETQQKGIIERVEGYRRNLDETSDLSRRISSLHELLEPRVTVMEEWRESADSAIHQIQSEMKDSVKEIRTPNPTQPTTPNSVKAQVQSSDAEGSRHATASNGAAELADALSVCPRRKRVCSAGRLDPTEDFDGSCPGAAEGMDVNLGWMALYAVCGGSPESVDPQRTRSSVAALQWGKFGPFAEALTQCRSEQMYLPETRGLYSDLPTAVPVKSLPGCRCSLCPAWVFDLLGFALTDAASHRGGLQHVSELHNQQIIKIFLHRRNFASSLPGNVVDRDTMAGSTADLAFLTPEQPPRTAPPPLTALGTSTSVGVAPQANFATKASVVVLAAAVMGTRRWRPRWGNLHGRKIMRQVYLSPSTSLLKSYRMSQDLATTGTKTDSLITDIAP
ncbi:hypothetical protein AK812_SmicGene31673 [Symbiodinium microadriaticum]|uniref:Uncharacterized protein n=1 Tax=Symbiodinium microadriaticum TaxID=2951 RepID=A0A1Q9CW67_SYMMI|nr:hypothetical protein AK812_SmicGene31673 [Symbiodinium microadriaticum]CAE7562721.1 unnamed protein product [Symbiodinium microadriaticum]